MQSIKYVRQACRAVPVTWRSRRKLRLLALTAALVLLILPLSSCAGARSESGVVLAGSTSVQPYAEILAQEYEDMHADIQIDVQGGGSSAGIMAVQSGTADIGMSSRNLNPDNDEKLLWSVEIARDGLAIIVHPDNPIGSVTLEQLRQIYAGTVTHWSQLGGNDARINLIAREEGSGTRKSFQDEVMGKERITPKAMVATANGAVKQTVRGDKNAIGFISLGMVDESVKALSLDGESPKLDNGQFNDRYPLTRPFLFVAIAEPTGAAAAFVDFVLEDEGQRLLAGRGLVHGRDAK